MSWTRVCALADLADDAIQETWLKAVRRIGNYDPTRGPFATWVCGIGSNVVRNAMRSRRRLTLRVGALAGDCPAPDSDTRQDDAAEASLLDLFLLEKVAYELCYEAANRPDWLWIPLRGFADIAARLLHITPGVLQDA